MPVRRYAAHYRFEELDFKIIFKERDWKGKRKNKEKRLKPSQKRYGKY